MNSVTPIMNSDIIMADTGDSLFKKPLQIDVILSDIAEEDVVAGNFDSERQRIVSRSHSDEKIINRPSSTKGIFKNLSITKSATASSQIQR